MAIEFTVGQALTQLQFQGLQRLDAQMLTLHALGRSAHDRAWLLAHDTDPLGNTALTALQHAAGRRKAGEPVAYITGTKEFFGLPLTVDARVLVPRPDTETLVQWALDVLPADAITSAAAPRVVDLGTGSGAIALALKSSRPQWEVVAVDASAGALDVASHNARQLGLQVELLQGSWLQPVVGLFDAIVSNPPYIASADPHLRDLVHEPVSALASGADGLDDLRHIIAQAPHHLRPGGWLLLEHGYDQAGPVCDLLTAAGLQAAQSRCDLAGIARCSGARMPQS